MSDPALPDHLYKYQSFSTQSLSNLKSRQIWFARPASFNDPFDCAINVFDMQFSESDLEQLFDHLSNKHKSPAWGSQYRSAGKLNTISSVMLFAGYKLASKIVSATITTSAVSRASPTEPTTSCSGATTLMGRGFCLEFATSDDPFDKARPVGWKRL